MKSSVTVRMYNQRDLGDCFLLKFKVGKKEVFILIDFGSYSGNNKEMEKVIAQSIKATVSPDAVFIIVLTHQHKDHLSGFINAYEELKKMKVSKLWLSFLDDPKSKEGKVIKDLTQKYWSKNKEVVDLIKKKYKGDKSVDNMLENKKSFDLFAEAQQGGEAITNLLQLAKNKASFLTPGESFDMPGLPNNTVKVYVLGPPLEYKFINKLNPSKNEEVKELSALNELKGIDSSINLIFEALEASITSTKQNLNNYYSFPFSENYSIVPKNNKKNHLIANYKKEKWRQIDNDWLSEVGRLSLHMDRLTNNTSLVLAFELVETGKVLLFVGDAQIGNWKSWFNLKFDNDVTAEDILSRTVLYKAGHHSSHNATLLQGLDLMDEKELLVMIPVNQAVSSSRNFAMLKPTMLRGYNRKSQGRVLRSDTVFHKMDSTTDNFRFPFMDKNPKIKVHPEDSSDGEHLYIEYSID